MRNEEWKIILKKKKKGSTTPGQIKPRREATSLPAAKTSPEVSEQQLRPSRRLAEPSSQIGAGLIDRNEGFNFDWRRTY